MKKKSIFMLLITAIVAVLTGCGSKKIVLNDYLTYDFSGYDGYGRANAHIDYDAMSSDLVELMGKKGQKIEGENAEDIADLACELFVEGDWEDYENLSNGDKVSYVWEIDDDIEAAFEERTGVKLDAEGMEVEVEGLENPDKFDISEHLTIECSGVSGSGKISVSSDLTGFIIEKDKNEKLSNGDVVTITFSPKNGKTLEEACASAHIPTFDTTYKYDVQGLANYVTSSSEIPSETMDILKSTSEEEFEDLYMEDTCSGLDIYWHKNFDEKNLVAVGVTAYSDYYTSNSNKVLLIYEAKYSGHGDVVTYIPVNYSNITDTYYDDIWVIGSIEYHVNCEVNGLIYHGFSSIDELVEYYKNDWDVEDISIENL